MRHLPYLLLCCLPGLVIAGPVPEPSDAFPQYAEIHVAPDRVDFGKGAELAAGQWQGWSYPAWKTKYPPSARRPAPCRQPTDADPHDIAQPVALACNAEYTWFAMVPDECQDDSDRMIYAWRHSDDTVHPIAKVLADCERPVSATLVDDELWILTQLFDTKAWGWDTRLQVVDLKTGDLRLEAQRHWRDIEGRQLAADPHRHGMWVLFDWGIGFLHLPTGQWQQRYFHLQLEADDSVTVHLSETRQASTELMMFNEFIRWPITERRAFAAKWSKLENPTWRPVAEPALLPFYFASLARVSDEHMGNSLVYQLLNDLSNAGLITHPDIQARFRELYREGDFWRRSTILDYLDKLGWARESIAQEEARRMPDELRAGMLDAEELCRIFQDQRPGAERFYDSGVLDMPEAAGLLKCMGRASGWDELPMRALQSRANEVVAGACRMFSAEDTTREHLLPLLRAAARLQTGGQFRTDTCIRVAAARPRDVAEVARLLAAGEDEPALKPVILPLLNFNAPYLFSTFDDWSRWWKTAPPEQRARVTEAVSVRSMRPGISISTAAVLDGSALHPQESHFCTLLRAGRPLPPVPPNIQRIVPPCAP